LRPRLGSLKLLPKPKGSLKSKKCRYARVDEHDSSWMGSAVSPRFQAASKSCHIALLYFHY
jgi:hypothetical protein